MPRKANATIGTITCPISGDVAAVRKERNGRLYFVSTAGKMTPYTEAGQGWMIEHAIIWGPDGAPPGTPDWVVAGRASPPDSAPDQELEPATPPADEAAPERSTPDPAPGPPPAPPTLDDDDDDVFGFN